MISGREATARLVAGSGITTRSARRVLDCGLAGAPSRSAGATLYDDAAVDALLVRRWLDPLAEGRLFPHGLLVSRRAFDVLATTPGECLTDGWDFSMYTRAWIRHVLELQGHFPLVATICGFVVGAADIIGVRPGGRHASGIDLREPCTWSEEVRDTWLPTGPGRDFSLRWPSGMLPTADAP